MIAYCTLCKYGTYSRKLMQSLPHDGTVITFNYDLLLDQEQMDPPDLHTQYDHFRQLVLDEERVPANDANGLFLKMHGSLNWFRCTNAACPASSRVALDTNTKDCLHRALGIHVADESCPHCGGDTIPLIVAPLLRKPITEDALIRTIWGLAKRKLSDSDIVVLVGFSAAPTDFYASWLIRTTVGVRSGVNVIVVNPANDRNHPDHREHSKRMSSIFAAQVGTGQFDDRFRTFAEIEDVLNLLRERGAIRNA
jgi:NAD-dependent SIR2 family protein deacetylase